MAWTDERVSRRLAVARRVDALMNAPGGRAAFLAWIAEAHRIEERCRAARRRHEEAVGRIVSEHVSALHCTKEGTWTIPGTHQPLRHDPRICFRCPDGLARLLTGERGVAPFSAWPLVFRDGLNEPKRPAGETHMCPTWRSRLRASLLIHARREAQESWRSLPEHFRWAWPTVRMEVTGPFPAPPIDLLEEPEDYRNGITDPEKLALYGSSLATLREEMLPTKVLPPDAFTPALVAVNAHAMAARDGLILIPAVRGYQDPEYAESMLRRVEASLRTDTQAPEAASRTQTADAEQHQQKVLTAVIADLVAEEQARARMLARHREGDENWQALIKDPEWKKMEGDFHAAEAPYTRLWAQYEGRDYSTLPADVQRALTQARIDSERTIAAIRRRAAALMSQYGAGMPKLPEVPDLLRMAAHCLEQFGDDLETHFVVRGEWYCSPNYDPSTEQRPDQAFDARRHVYRAVERLDDALRLMVLRDAGGLLLSQARVAQWDKGEWRASGPWRELGETLLPLVRTIWRRYTTYCGAETETNGVQILRIPREDARWLRATADRLVRLAQQCVSVPTAVSHGEAPNTNGTTGKGGDEEAGQAAGNERILSWTKAQLIEFTERGGSFAISSSTFKRVRRRAQINVAGRNFRFTVDHVRAMLDHVDEAAPDSAQLIRESWAPLATR